MQRLKVALLGALWLTSVLWFASARAGSVRLDAVSQDGELLGGSLPALWSLPARSSSDDK